MVVATREPKAATTVFTPVCPGNVLGFTSGNRLANSRVATMGSITALHGFLWRHVTEDRNQLAFFVVAETHVEVPLVVCLERLHPTGNWMLRQVAEIRGPVWID